MMKIVKAVPPYKHSGFLNFKYAPFCAWERLGGKLAKAHYPWKVLHGLAYRWELPTLWKNKTEARLRFIEPVSISFDTFPDYARYEIIPFVWDCWPCHFEKMCRWLTKHDVRTAIFTSSQTAERIKERFPCMNVMYCPEGVKTSKHTAGKELKDRSIDVLEFGRAMFSENDNMNVNENEDKNKDSNGKGSINYVCTKRDGKFVFTNKQLVEAMGDAKVTIALPRSITHPEVAGDIETLTQRYWECMLSRMVMVGHAPKELVDLIGYNPVIELNRENAVEHISQILSNIDDEKYQKFVNKNRQVALEMGPWSIRMRQVVDWLKQMGYEV